MKADAETHIPGCGTNSAHLAKIQKRTATRRKNRLLRQSLAQRFDATIPPEPSMTVDEQADWAEATRIVEQMARDLKQRNLNAAVRLAVEAAGGRGHLVEHFAELGRRFGFPQPPVQPRFCLGSFCGGTVGDAAPGEGVAAASGEGVDAAKTERASSARSASW